MTQQPRPPYRVLCYAKDCENDAIFKIAARWSDGVTSELKTYSLACSKCVPVLFQDARIRKSACRLAAGESLGDPQVFEMIRGRRDRELLRRKELEAS
ncbi:MAG TPA: hypothetical protein VHR66_00525 [Gemmataceae bacterium]|jgi:hypothetical protein|nr:hypothetical protein [Gemmataceae bacterium]